MMIDGHGRRAATALWPLQLPLHRLLSSREVFFLDGGLNVFLDKGGVLSDAYGDAFMGERAAILGAFVAHYAHALDRETVMAQAVRAEQAFVARFIADLDSAKLNDQHHASRDEVGPENIGKVRVLLQRPTPAQLVTLKAIGGRDCS